MKRSLSLAVAMLAAFALNAYAQCTCPGCNCSGKLNSNVYSTGPRVQVSAPYTSVSVTPGRTVVSPTDVPVVAPPAQPAPPAYTTAVYPASYTQPVVISQPAVYTPVTTVVAAPNTVVRTYNGPFVQRTVVRPTLFGPRYYYPTSPNVRVCVGGNCN